MLPPFSGSYAECFLVFFTKADNTIQTFGTDVGNKEQTWEVIEHDLAR